VNARGAQNLPFTTTGEGYENQTRAHLCVGCL
jgi:hypothetical protein